jgi:hypothetical protein
MEPLKPEVIPPSQALPGTAVSLRLCRHSAPRQSLGARASSFVSEQER